MARLPPTPEDIARGERLRALREHDGKTQDDVFPGKHQQVLNAEKGRNKFNGMLVRVLADHFGPSLEIFEAYLHGALSLADYLKARTSGAQVLPQRGGGQQATAPRVVDKRAALDVIRALTTLDNVPPQAALDVVADIELEDGDALTLYIQARLVLAAGKGKSLPGESVVLGPDVAQPANKKRSNRS